MAAFAPDPLCSTSAFATTTRRGRIAACSSPTRSPTRSPLAEAAQLLVATSSAASSTSTSGLPDHTSLQAILTTALRSRAANRLYRSRPASHPLTRNPPPLLHTSPETALLRVLGTLHVPVQHLARPPAEQAHGVTFSPTLGHPDMSRGVPQLMWMDLLDAGL